MSRVQLALNVSNLDSAIEFYSKLFGALPAKVRPGAKVDVAVVVRDPQGQPVVAEVALALVDQALLALRADAAPTIGAFFYGDLRETAFRTSSSCTWSYEGKSRRVNAELLAEDRAKANRADAEPVYRGPGDAVPPPVASAAPAPTRSAEAQRAMAGMPVQSMGGGGMGRTRGLAEIGRAHV